MGYSSYLKQLLIPLGIYNLERNSYNLAELEVLGMAFDDCCAEIMTLEKECVIPTAEDYGITMYEAILPRNHAITVERKREAIASMLSINNNCFTADMLNSVLSGVGEPTRVDEIGEIFKVLVDFTDITIKPLNFEILKKWVEGILPCHLDVLYAFELI